MRRKRGPAIVPILVFVVALLAGAYALFGEALFIGGTVGTTGTFDIRFHSAVVTDTVGANPVATISPDSKTLTIVVADLAYPGAGTQIDVVVRNVGTIPAILRTITITGDDDPDIVVELLGLTEDIPLTANEDHSFSLRVYWSSVSTTGDKNIVFTVELGYEQDTVGGY